MRSALLSKLALIVTVLMVAAASVSAQFATPTIDGFIAPGEYGSNNSLSNAGNTGQTWYMTWDSNYLYVGIVNANIYEGGVLYIKPNPQNPLSCCSNADGNLSGFNYDNEQFTTLPFRASFVTYFKNGYREFRTADGFGNWSGATAHYGQYADNQSNTTPANWPSPGAPLRAAEFHHRLFFSAS